MKNLTENYHTHTFRCGHACGEDREYIENAIKAGMKVLGFSDHSPMPFKSGHKSGHRIPLDMAQDYFDSISALREEYKNDIEIHIGVEAEYYPDTFDEFQDYLSAFPCEYMILGQHFLWREEDKVIVYRDTVEKSRIQGFYRNVLEGYSTGKFLYVAHPDIVKFVGESEDYTSLTTYFLERLKEMDAVIGFNRLGLFENRMYPRDDFWRIAGEVGIKAIIELDAHDPNVFLDEETVDRCREKLDSFGVNVINHLDIKR